MNQKQMFQNQTKLLAVQVIEMTNHLPKTVATEVFGRQVIRSAMTVASIKNPTQPSVVTEESSIENRKSELC
jgi:hypothetical protein